MFDDGIPTRKKLKYIAAGVLFAMIVAFFLPSSWPGPSNDVVFRQAGNPRELKIRWHSHELIALWDGMGTSFRDPDFEGFWAAIDGDQASVLVCRSDGGIQVARLDSLPSATTSVPKASGDRLAQTLRDQFAGATERDFNDARLFDWFCHADGKNEFRKRYLPGDGSTIPVP